MRRPPLPSTHDGAGAAGSGSAATPAVSATGIAAAISARTTVIYYYRVVSVNWCAVDVKLSAG